MGYHTNYSGEIAVTPPLKPEHVDLLKHITGQDSERQKDVFAEPVPLTFEQSVLRERFDGQTISPFFGAFPFDYLPEPPPHSEHCGLDCGVLDPSDYDDSRTDCNEAAEMLSALVKLVFKPLGYSLSGAVDWSGDSSDDRGVIWVEGDQVEAVQDVTSNPGPSWERAKEEEVK